MGLAHIHTEDEARKMEGVIHRMKQEGEGYL